MKNARHMYIAALLCIVPLLTWACSGGSGLSENPPVSGNDSPRVTIAVSNEAIPTIEYEIYTALLPAINRIYPYRTESDPNAGNPLGVRRVPTSSVVLRDFTAPGMSNAHSTAATREAITTFIDSSLGAIVNGETLDSYFSHNEKSYPVPSQIFADKTVTSYGTVTAELSAKEPRAKNYTFVWWVGLAEAYPHVSVLVTVSRPGFDAAGTRALVSAVIEQNAGADIIYYFALEKYEGQWFITNSATLPL